MFAALSLLAVGLLALSPSAYLPPVMIYLVFARIIGRRFC